LVIRPSERPGRSAAEEELDWLPREPATVAALVERVLGVLLDYDRAHDGQLVPTLRTWLESGQRPSLVARRLGIHQHTLTYRLSRIQDLTGRDLRSPGTVAETWLALRASDTRAADRELSGLPADHAPHTLCVAELGDAICEHREAA
jgi:DNA-binding PucR family transcriptional regulator